MDPRPTGSPASASPNGRHDGSDMRFPIVIDDTVTPAVTTNPPATPAATVKTEPAASPQPLALPRPPVAKSQLVFVAKGIRCFISGPGSSPLRAGGPSIPTTATATVTSNVASPGLLSVPDHRARTPTHNNNTLTPGSAQPAMATGGAAILAPSLKASCGYSQSNHAHSKTASQACHKTEPQPSQSFDFNSNDALPWDVPTGPRRTQVPEFSKCNDKALLDYLAQRRVSTGFLFEIDQFLSSNLRTIEKYSPEFVELMSSLPPLDAYLYFVKGWTRPARYIDGVILSNPFTLPGDFVPKSLRDIHDGELDDFFAGFDYRYDILDRIDNEVRYACVDICRGLGSSVRADLRRLVCYVIYGNPVDAYKFYEYNYQQDYMPHRYLPEHVVLGDVPKPNDYCEPVPSSVQGWKNHRIVRDRMARAKDQGVDVVDVLLKEYRIALAKKGLRRAEIDNLYCRAQERIDSERRHPTGVDVVDMIMDDALNRQSSRPTSRPFFRHIVVAPNCRVTFKPIGRRIRQELSIKPKGASSRPAKRRAQTAIGKALRRARDNLLTTYKDEGDVLNNPGGHSSEYYSLVQKSRGVAERKYVNNLVKYGRDTQRMSAEGAAELQRMFTKIGMEGRGPVYRDYLLSLFPAELN